MTWTGATSSAWATGSNWSGAAEPSTGDTAIIDGAVSIDGVDKSAVNLANLFIRPTYTGQFGTSAANPVKVAVSVVCSVLGGSAVYLNSGATNPIVSLEVAMPTPQHVFDLGGTITYARFMRGSIYTAATATNYTFEPLDDNSLNLVDTKFNGGTITVADIINSNATVLAATSIATLHLINGTLLNYAGTYTTVNVIGKAEFKHYHTATITTVECKMGGFFNATVDPRAKTVSNIIQHSRSRVNLNNGAASITATNGVKTPARVASQDYGDVGGGGVLNP